MLKKLQRSDLDRLAQLVRDETGNHVQEKNYVMLESRLSSHMLKLNISSIEEYWKYFSENEAQERSVLQSLMTTHYTFFFREPIHFELLGQWLARELNSLKARYAKDKSPLRVWSAACSRGQEVYSLAMWLEQNLVTPHGIPYEITATDIDPESVAYGKNGVYPIKEVNTIPQHYLRGFWKRGTGSIKEFAAIHPNLKVKTNFMVKNLLEISAWKTPAQFDVVFCRNVFIYFSEDNVKKIALSICEKLTASGLFVSGISEPLRFSGFPLKALGPSAYSEKTAAINSSVTTTAMAPQTPASSNSKAIDASFHQVATEQTSPSKETSYHVLCVDDSPTIQAMMKRIFSGDPNCKSVTIANNGREAREALDKKKFDLITLDIHMPEVTGIEFLERLYNKKTDPPVIMISSVNRSDVDLATKSLSLGAFDYVEKPAMNNLQKSTDEILTKAKMALRHTAKDQISEFDVSIGQKIVVPDASQCLRLIVASERSYHRLNDIFKTQKDELRSPPLLVVSLDSISACEAAVIKSTTRKVMTLRDPIKHLRPNHVYIAGKESVAKNIADLKFSQASLQVLDNTRWDAFRWPTSVTVQFLLDEAAQGDAESLVKMYGLPLSDLCPSTSFSSLSVEFFASLRKAAA